MVIAPTARWTNKQFPKLLGKGSDGLFLELARDVNAGNKGACASTLTGKEPRQFIAGVLPNKLSRYNAPSRSESIKHVVQASGIASGKGKASILLLLDDPSHLQAAVHAVAGAFPLFSERTGPKSSRRIQILVMDCDSNVLEVDPVTRSVAEYTRDSAALVDTPPCELHPAEFARRAKEMLSEIPGVKIKDDCWQGADESRSSWN